MDAGSVWQETYTQLLNQNGISNGLAWPAVFCCKQRDIKLLVHGDDFLVLADEDGQGFLASDENFQTDLPSNAARGRCASLALRFQEGFPRNTFPG